MFTLMMLSTSHFLLAEREIYRLTSDAVLLYLQRRRTYEDVVLHGCYGHAQNAILLRLIRYVCKDCRIGAYPETFMFQCCHHADHPDYGPKDDGGEDMEKYKVGKRDYSIIVQKKKGNHPEICCGESC